MTVDDFNESTGLSWLWAALFGPFYFVWHGFWGRAAIILVLALLTGIGWIFAPFIVYGGWRDRARQRWIEHKAGLSA